MAGRTKQPGEPAAPRRTGMTVKTPDARRKELFGKAPGRQQLAMTTPVRTATVSSSALRKINDDSTATKQRRRNRATTDRTWQTQVFDFAEQVGELGALLTLQSNVVSLCGFPVRRWDEERGEWLANDPDVPDDLVKMTATKEVQAPPTPAPAPPAVPGQPAPLPAPISPIPPPAVVKMEVAEPTTAKSKYDDRPSNVMRAFVGPDGEQKELVRRAAWNIFAAGEVTLLGTPSKDAKGILWEFLSIEELYPNASGEYVRQRGGAGSAQETLPADNFTGRCWRSSPRFSDLADSEVKRVLPILQEIVTLTMMIDAIAQSRLSANMLFVPEEMSFSSARDGDTPEDADDEDDLDQELFDHMTAPIGDRTSASRVVPLVIRGKGEQGQYIKVIDLSRSFDDFAQGLRTEALDRLGKGLDAPPEAITGKGSVNHWTAANIDSEFIVKHIQPVGQLIADFLTMAFLRPMLEAYEDMSPDEAATFKIEFDPSPVIARADEAKSAMDLSDWLSDEALLSANGFTKADAASGETVRQRRLWKLVSTQPAQFGKLLPLVDGFHEIDPALLTPSAAPASPSPGPAAPAAPSQGPPAGGPKTTNTGTNGTGDGVPKTGNQQPASGAPRPGTEPKANNLGLLVERITTASDAAIARAIDRAGSRLVSLAQSKAPDLHARIRSVRKPNVMSMCTDSDLRSLNVSRESLLRASWDQLAVDTRRWVAAYLEDDGMDHPRADQTAAQCAQELTSRLQTIVHDRLLTPISAGDNGLRVPAGLVTEVLEQAAFAAAV